MVIIRRPSLRAALLFVLGAASIAPLSCTLTYPVRSPEPYVRFLDLESGPSSGGEQGQGTIVTLYGDRFGEARGRSRVTIDGREVARYLRWSETEISVAIGATASSGPLVVETNWGRSGDETIFTVRSGTIRCVSSDGADEGSGTWGGCWRSVGHALSQASPGDIVYLRDGVEEAATLSVERAGSQDMPIAIVAYPGETATLRGGIRVPNTGARPSDLTLAGVRIVGGDRALELSGARWRIVACEIECTAMLTEQVGEGCLWIADSEAIGIVGNEIHDLELAPVAGTSSAVAISVSSNVRDLELAWNRVHDNHVCGDVLISSDGGTGPSAISIHHNRFTDNRGVGIHVEEVDSSGGPIDVANNVFARIGSGTGRAECSESVFPEPVCVSAACVVGDTEAVHVRFNTFVGCGAGGSRAVVSGCGSSAEIVLDDNVVVQSGGDFYAAPATALRGLSNLWYGAGAGPPSCEDNVDAREPPFVSDADGDYRLRAESEGVDRATGAAPARDADGAPRPRGRAADLGAFER